jgi:hypothetical protein
VPEEGTKSDGQQSESDSLAEVNAELQIAAQDRAAFSEEAYTLDTRPEVMDRVALGWAEAVAKDERSQNRRSSDSVKPSRSRASLRAQYRAQQDWQRTVRRVQSQYWYTPPSSPTAPYSKGQDRTWFNKVTGWLWRMWGLD